MTEIPTPAPDEIVFGLDTFGDVPRGEDGELVSFGRALRATLQEAIVADELGVDAFAVGEHHREEFAISSRRRCSPASPPRRRTSPWPPGSPSCPRTIRSGCSNASPRSTGCRTVGPR